MFHKEAIKNVNSSVVKRVGKKLKEQNRIKKV